MSTLSGLKILDFSTLMPGPIATTFLADMGAEVVTIAAPNKPDLMNTFPPLIDELGISASAAWLGRNKKSIFLNLKKSSAVEAVKKMVQEYDIVIEQFRPGVMEKLGLDYESLKKVNPRLIYCSITGYGQTGPLAMRPGHDINYVALSGNLLLMDPDADKMPKMPNFQLADIAGGSYTTVMAVLAAAYHRTQTGKGQYIDISMLDGILPFCCIEASGVLASRQYPAGWEGRTLSGLAQGPSYGFFETADGRYMSVGALESKFFTGLCNGIGRPDLSDGKLARQEPERFHQILEEIFRTKTLKAWKEIFDNIDTCVEPVLTMEEMCTHPQIKARNMIPEVPIALSTDKTVQQIGTPIKFSETPVEYHHTAYPAGYHTEEILQGFGYTASQIADMAQS